MESNRSVVGFDEQSISSQSSKQSKSKSKNGVPRKWRKIVRRNTESNPPITLEHTNKVKDNGAGPYFNVSRGLGVENRNHYDDDDDDDVTSKYSTVSDRESSATLDRYDSRSRSRGDCSDLDESDITDAHGDADGDEEEEDDDIDDDSFRETQDSDYDTDLEINTHKWVYPEKYDHDSTGLTKYIRACDEEGVKPIRFFIRHIQDVEFNLKHHGLSTADLRALSAPLETNTTIETIDLEGNWIMAEGTFQLCKVLRENVFVTHLNLAENKIDSEGVKPVCSLLMDNKHIEYLNLSGNDIGDRAAESFFQLLTTNTVLKSLNLRHNKFEDGSAHYFRDAMMENETLQVLDLSWNCFMCKGCIQLAQGLKENVGLKECSFAMSGFGLMGGKKLGEAIMNNRTLQRLDVSYCRLPKEAAPDLAHGFHHNDALVYFDMSNNFIQDDGSYEILCAIDQNDTSSLKWLNLGTTIVHDNFKDLEEKLKDERQLRVIHGGVGYGFIKIKEYNPMEAFLRDPMTKLKMWVEEAGYRMVDLFRHFDRDQSQSMSHEEFKQGIRRSGITVTDQQMNILIERLDSDWDGEIDFKELIDGDKIHRKVKRDVLKIVQEQEERAKEIHQPIPGGTFAVIAAGVTRKVARKSISY